MFLPEHKQAILKRKREQGKLQKPELDEQHLEKINRMLKLAREIQAPVSVRFFEDGSFREITGTVKDFRPLERELKLLKKTGEAVFLKMDAIIDVERA